MFDNDGIGLAMASGFFPHQIPLRRYGGGCRYRSQLAVSTPYSACHATYILMVDDDTYVNYDLLIERYRNDIYGIMQSVPIVMGEFQGTPEHLTTKGIFAGGSGYFISKAAINRLVSNASIYYAPGDKHHYRTPEQQRGLSVAIEAFRRGSSTCPEDCVDYDPLKNPPIRAYPPVNADLKDDSWKSQSGLLPNSSFISISVPLIDLCSNMMANEHTCLHSDHSLGRCLIYGAHVVPVGMVCQRTFESANETEIDMDEINHGHNRDYNASRSVIDKDGKRISYVKVLDTYHTRPKFLRHTGMCFMSQSCDSDQITCHRFKAMYKTGEGIVVPVKYYKHPSYYKLVSSCEVMGIGRGATPLRWCDE